MMISQLTYNLILIAVGLLMPYLAIKNSGTVKQILQQQPHLKVGIYIQGIVVQWFITVAIVVAMWFSNDSLVEIGISNHAGPYVVILLLMLLSSVWIYTRFKPKTKTLNFITKLYRHVSHYLPQTQRQYKWGVVLSYTAGFCEELIYRGFVYWQLSTWFGMWPSVILANVIFALTHYATGWKNSIGALALGLVFSWIYLSTGDLWLAAVMHTAIDLLAMTLFPLTSQLSETANPSLNEVQNKVTKG